MFRIRIITYYIYYCIISFTKPWRFFQLNAKYFNDKKGIFSKYDIEKEIPDKWKLSSGIIAQNI